MFSCRNVSAANKPGDETLRMILVLDIGGVVYRSFPDDAFHARWAGRCGHAPEELARRLWTGEHWAKTELGQMSRGDCLARIAAEVGVTPQLAETMVLEAWASQPDEALATFVGALRASGVTVAALTNNAAREAELMARPELARLFDLVVSSADAGLAKPDAAIYRLTEARLGATAEALVFVDDTESNVTAARALGWQGVWFRSTDQALAELRGVFGR
jgi:putative hydrolase of the HAD superfamily